MKKAVSALLAAAALICMAGCSIPVNEPYKLTITTFGEPETSVVDADVTDGPVVTTTGAETSYDPLTTTTSEEASKAPETTTTSEKKKSRRKQKVKDL